MTTARTIVVMINTAMAIIVEFSNGFVLFSDCELGITVCSCGEVGWVGSVTGC